VWSQDKDSIYVSPKRLDYWVTVNNRDHLGPVELAGIFLAKHKCLQIITSWYILIANFITVRQKEMVQACVPPPLKKDKNKWNH